MKNFFTLLSLFVVSIALSQTPQGFNYQAVIRNSTGQAVTNQSVSVKFNIIQGQPSAAPTYIEQHTVNTDDLGTVNLVIGQGSATLGTFPQIDWSLGSYYLGIEVNIGQGFVNMGTTQLLSVPYAMYAEKVGNSFGIAINATLVNNGGEYSVKVKYRVTPNPDDNYILSGYVVGSTPNVDVTNALQNYDTFGEFSYSDDFSFTSAQGLELNSTYYIRGYVRKSDNTYVYGQPKTFVATP